MIRNLYKKQKAAVRFQDQKFVQKQKAAVRFHEKTTACEDIKREVKQGRGMSPDLFKLYSKTILRKTDEVLEGHKVNCTLNLRYAKDVSAMGLQ